MIKKHIATVLLIVTTYCGISYAGTLESISRFTATASKNAFQNAHAQCIRDGDGLAEPSHLNRQRCFRLQPNGSPYDDLLATYIPTGLCYGQRSSYGLSSKVWTTYTYVYGGNTCHTYEPIDTDTNKFGPIFFRVYLDVQQCPAGTRTDPETGECVGFPGEEGDSCPTGGTNPINLGVGNKHETETDFTGSGQFPLAVSRTFNSTSAAWQFLTEIRPNAAVTQALVVRRDGKKLPFSADGLGGWTADPDVTGTLASFDDGAGNITGWRYTTLDKVVEDYDASGKLLAVTDRTGLSHSYAHTTTDITVTHSNGDVLIYQLDSIGRISGFITPDNEQYTYTYDAWGNLTSLTYPNGGGTRTYHYENTTFPNALTGITDANGDRFATWTYDTQGRAISSEHFGGAEKVTLDYTYLNDPTDPRTTATNALGKQTTYHFTTLYGVRKVTQVEGHPSANCAAANKNYTYDANGFMASKTDWKGNTTTYVRNSKGQELSRTEATGTPQARTVVTEWHPTFNLRIKVTEPNSETTYTYDTSGNLVNQQTIDLSVP